MKSTCSCFVHHKPHRPPAVKSVRFRPLPTPLFPFNIHPSYNLVYPGRSVLRSTRLLVLSQREAKANFLAPCLQACGCPPWLNTVPPCPALSLSQSPLIRVCKFSSPL